MEKVVSLSKGIVVHAKVNLLTFLRKLRPEDLKGAEIKETFNLGTKTLIPRKRDERFPICMRDFNAVRDRVDYILKQNSFYDGLIRFVPYKLAGETLRELALAEDRLDELKRVLLDNYDDIKRRWTELHPEISMDLYPSEDEIRRKIRMDWSATEFTVPEGMEAHIMESESLEEIISSAEERAKLVERVKQKTQEAIGSFADTCARQLAERCANAAKDLYEAIVKAGDGRLNGRALRAFDDAAKRLEALNWMNDETIQGLLEESGRLVRETGLITFEVSDRQEHIEKLQRTLRQMMDLSGKASEVAAKDLKKAADAIKVETKKAEPKGEHDGKPVLQERPRAVRGLLAGAIGGAK